MKKIMNVRMFLAREDLEKWCSYMIATGNKEKLNYKVFEEDLRAMLAVSGLEGLKKMDLSDIVDKKDAEKAINLVKRWYGEVL